jgi:hypothetical protein
VERGLETAYNLKALYEYVTAGKLLIFHSNKLRGP